MPRSYVPSKDVDLQSWANNFTTVLTANPANYGLTATDASACAAAYTAFAAALTLARNPATKTAATVAAKDLARNSMLVLIRPYATLISKSIGISNANKLAIGVTVPDPTRTPIVAPTSAPVITPLQGTPLQLKIAIKDENALPKQKAKPAGAIAMELRCFVGTVAPVSADATPFKAILTKSPAILVFAAGDGGKTAYLYGRWMTARGLLGPWSAIATATVPA